jgi:ribosome-binding ATPase YchF (GTP1/OBG family)
LIHSLYESRHSRIAERRQVHGFNSLTRVGAESQNYPFTTIDPNLGVAVVPDGRLDALAEVMKSKRVVAATVDFVDIAGLVRGASAGEGLGNQFLGHIRECDAIAHVVRCFDDENVVHVHGRRGPRGRRRDHRHELLLADLATVERRLERTSKAAKGGDAKLKAEAAELERLRITSPTVARRGLTQGPRFWRRR